MRTKKALCALLAAVMIVGAVSCKSKNEVETAFDDKAKQFLSQMKSLDVNKFKQDLPQDYLDQLFASGMVDEDQVSRELVEYFLSDEFLSSLAATLKSYAGKFSYEIVSSKVSGDTATLEVKFEVPDLMGAVMGFALDPEIQAITSGEVTTAAMKAVLTKMLTAISGAKTKSLTATVTMIKDENGKWAILVDRSVINVLCGGLVDTLSTFGVDADSIFGSMGTVTY